MQRVARRLPVHVLLDIDGTLLHPCRPRFHSCGDDGGDDDILSSTVATLNAGAAALTSPVLAPFSCPPSRVRQVLLRPHVVPFLAHLLVDKALDTTRVAVFVSLYTRQSAAYCEAVARQLLTPALLQHRPQLSPSVSPLDLFHRLYSGGHCVQPALGDLRDASPVSPSACWLPTTDWTKTISVTSCPLTTVLVDDKSANLRPLELATGRGVLLPSFHPSADEFAGDDCLAVWGAAEDALYDVLSGSSKSSGSGGGVQMRAAASCFDSFTDATSLVELLSAFVQVCHDHSETIEAAQRQNLFNNPYTEKEEEKYLLQQGQLQTRMLTHAASLEAFNFLDISPVYRRVWNSFHAPRERMLHSVLADYPLQPR